MSGSKAGREAATDVPAAAAAPAPTRLLLQPPAACVVVWGRQGRQETEGDEAACGAQIPPGMQVSAVVQPECACAGTALAHGAQKKHAQAQ